MITRRRFIKASTAVLGVGAATAGLYAWRIEPHWLEIVERQLPIANLPKDLVGSRLVQLSDLHIGSRVDDAFLLRTFQRVREIAPEFVVYTGDFTNREDRVFEHAQRMFPHLPLGSRGTFGILGNHDLGLDSRGPHPRRTVQATISPSADSSRAESSLHLRRVCAVGRAAHVHQQRRRPSPQGTLQCQA